MSVHQTKTGLWFAKWYESGKEKRKYFDLEAKAVEHDAEIKRAKTEVNTFGLTVNQILKAYHEQHPIEQSTGLTDYYRITRILVPDLGQFYADQLGTERLNAFVQKRLAVGKKRSTIAREISVLKAAFAWAENQIPPLLSRNVLSKYRVSKARDHVIPGPPTKRELELILAHSEPHLSRALLLSWYTGIRPGSEITRLSWSDWDQEAGTLRVEGVRKGGPSIRFIPVSPELGKLLHTWRDSDTDGPIIRYRGQRVDSLKTAWKSAKASAGITRRLRMYDLRHAFATYALGAGADLKSVSRIMGHRREDTTIRIYQHVLDASQRDAVEHIPPVTLVSLIPRSKIKG